MTQQARLSAVPFIPPFEPPTEEQRAATARALAAHPDHLGSRAPRWFARMAAVSIDLGLCVGAVFAVSHLAGPATDPLAIGVLSWLVLRVVSLVAFERTPGEFLFGYSVLGPGGQRLGFGRALLRELTVVFGVAVLITLAVLALMSSRGRFPLPRIPQDKAAKSIDPRWPHDKLADCWPVRTR